jgi:hypothetical protein
MKFCLECHRNPEAYLRPREQVFNMAYKPDPELGRKLKRIHAVRSAEALTSCNTCHR